MLNNLNERAFGLEQHSIIKEVTGVVESVDPLNGIRL